MPPTPSLVLPPLFCFLSFHHFIQEREMPCTIIQSKRGACYACTQHGMTSTHSHLRHKSKGGGKVGQPTLEGGHHHMHSDPPLMALLLVSALFEIGERGWSVHHALVHPTQPFACIAFQKVGAMATLQKSPEGQLNLPS